MYKIVYAKTALKDIPKLKSAHLDEKAKALISVIKENPFQNPPPYEKLVGDLNGSYSRRINVQHRLVYDVFEEEHPFLPELHFRPKESEGPPMKKRLISLLVALCMAVTLLPVSALTAWAEESGSTLKPLQI